MEELKQFLAGGISHYGDAVRTARRFERESLILIDAAVSDQIDAGRLPTSADPVCKPNRRSDEPWMSSDVTVSLGREESAPFTLGLWWSRDVTGHDCVIYVGFHGGPAWARNGIQAPSGGLTKRLDRRRYTYLILPVNAESDLQEDLAVVMEEFLQGFDTARAAHASEDGAP